MTFFPRALKSCPPYHVSARSVVGYILYTRRYANGTVIDGAPKISIRTGLSRKCQWPKEIPWTCSQGHFDIIWYQTPNFEGQRERVAYRAIGNGLFPNELAEPAKPSTGFEFPDACLFSAKVSVIFQSRKDCCSSPPFEGNVFSDQGYWCGTAAWEC